MVVNKGAAGARRLTVTLAELRAHGAAAQVWQLTSSNAITRLADVPVVRRARADDDAARAEHHAVRHPARDHPDRPARGADRRPHRAVALGADWR